MIDTPIYRELIREQARRDAAAYVASLTATCPTCGSRVGHPCRTRSGNHATRPHAGRRWP